MKDVFGEKSASYDPENTVQRRKLKLNVGKSKGMRCTTEENRGGLHINLGREGLEEVESFRYLGSKVARNGEIREEVNFRVGEAGKAVSTRSCMPAKHARRA